MVGWSGGSAGADVFINLGENPNRLWIHGHTEFGEIADTESFDTLTAIVDRPFQTGGGMKMLQAPLTFQATALKKHKLEIGDDGMQTKDNAFLGQWQFLVVKKKTIEWNLLHSPKPASDGNDTFTLQLVAEAVDRAIALTPQVLGEGLYGIHC